MNVIDRIEQAPACEVINLTEAEKDIYTGAGWKLAWFKEGSLVELFDPTEMASADEALAHVMDWMAFGDGEFWLVMYSCYQLCEPIPVTLNDATAIARMARMFGELFS